jgi:ketosteroid isomerase-like protein
MSTQQAIDEADVRARIEQLLDAVRGGDLEGLKPLFAPDLVSFDIVPPLQHLGAEAKWKNWADVFAFYQPPLGYEVRELTITVGGEVAFAHSLNHVSGTLPDGSKSDYWLRWTSGWRKIDGGWFIVHDQVSVPTDFLTGRSVLDLEP